MTPSRMRDMRALPHTLIAGLLLLSCGRESSLVGSDAGDATDPPADTWPDLPIPDTTVRLANLRAGEGLGGRKQYGMAAKWRDKQGQSGQQGVVRRHGLTAAGVGRCG